MILKDSKSDRFYYTQWSGRFEWVTAICYNDKSKIKVKRTGVLTFVSRDGISLIRTTAKAINI